MKNVKEDFNTMILVRKVYFKNTCTEHNIQRFAGKKKITQGAE